jgi:DNA-binding transcriptional LysR family regulator
VFTRAIFPRSSGPVLDYPFRRLFDAGCRVADMEPNIVLESQAPRTLLALAEAEQGIAIIPSVLHPGAEVSTVAVQGPLLALRVGLPPSAFGAERHPNNVHLSNRPGEPG